MFKLNIKNNKALLIGLFFIILIGTGLRLYKLGEAPAGLYIDEAGQGYSAYSILKTGQDEFGKTLPIIFRSFTDFKTPVYIYLIVPLIPIFDLNSFTVRFPSFLFSVLTFPILFLLLQRLTPNLKYGGIFSLICCLLLAISPWHVLFGRTNFECNVALFFYLLGIYLFYEGLKKPWVLVLSAIIFAVSIPAYHSERVITPLTVLALWIRHYKTLHQKHFLKYKVGGLIIAILISIPTLSVMTTPGFFARASGLNIFSHQHQLPAGTIESYQGQFEIFINGTWFLSTKEFFSLYTAYSSPRFMFNLGDYGLRSSFPELATFYVWQLPFYLLGLYLIVKKRQQHPELSFLVILLIIICPIPAALTRDPYTTIRALPLVIPQIILVGLGVIYIFNLLKDRWYYLFGGVCISLIVLMYSVLQLYSSAIILNEYYRASEWDSGLEEVSNYLKDVYQDIPVVFDNSRDEMYIQLAFYLKYDPQLYQEQNFEVTPADYYNDLRRIKEKKIGKIITRPINWDLDLKIEQYLIGDQLAISYNQIEDHHLTLAKEIYYPDGSVAFRIVKTNPKFELRQIESDK